MKITTFNSIYLADDNDKHKKIRRKPTKNLKKKEKRETTTENYMFNSFSNTFNAHIGHEYDRQTIDNKTPNKC